MGLIRPWLQDTTITDLRDHKTQASPPTARAPAQCLSSIYKHKCKQMQTKAQTQNKNISYLCDKAFPTKQSQMPFEMQWKSACGGDCVPKIWHLTNLAWFCKKQNNLCVSIAIGYFQSLEKKRFIFCSILIQIRKFQFRKNILVTFLSKMWHLLAQKPVGVLKRLKVKILHTY